MASKIYFATDYAPSTDAFRLLEIPPDLERLFVAAASSSIDEQEPLVFRGPMTTTTLASDSAPSSAPRESGATLHTSSATYSVREVNTSNTLLVCGKVAADEWRVAHTTGNYMEPAPVPPPRLAESLHSLLAGTEAEDDAAFSPAASHSATTPTWKRVTRAYLLDNVQASPDELDRELARMNAVSVDGYIRLLTLSYVRDVLTLLVATAMALEMDLDALSCNAMAQQLVDDGVPAIVTSQLLYRYSTASRPDHGDTVVTLAIADQIPAVYGECILARLGVCGSMLLSDFEREWQASVPEPLLCDLKHLESMTVIHASSPVAPRFIYYMPLGELPGTVPERLKVLFGLRDTWPRPDLLRLVRDLTLDGSDKAGDSLLVKHARLIKTGGTVVFGPRPDMGTRR
ncbi:sister chromatid cohesion protein Dcc1 [Blastocladiella britannica]|nr:sister chromatid cohesion protein Dcc1 [Blastocladiella britannica]